MLKIARGLIELVALEIGLALLGVWNNDKDKSISDFDFDAASDFDYDPEFEYEPEFDYEPEFESDHGSDGTYDYPDISYYF